jgi:hypothetical protein
VSREITFHFPDGGVQRVRSSNSPRVGETVDALGQCWVVGAVTGDAYLLATPTQMSDDAPHQSMRGLGLRFLSVERVAHSGRSRS